MDVELDSSYTPHTFPKKSLESLSEEYVALSKQTIITFLNVLNTLLSFPTREIVWGGIGHREDEERDKRVSGEEMMHEW